MIRALTSAASPDSVREIAAAWVLEEEGGLSLSRNAMLEAWLAEAEEHLSAYEAARFAHDAVGRQGAALEMMALRDAALRARPDRRGFPQGLIAAGVALVLAVSASGWWAVDRARPSGGAPPEERAELASAGRYETAVGERSTVNLPDGSSMTLNTATVTQVDYTAHERGVVLLTGQAVFTVAHDRPTPFRVYAGDRVITATGTAFEVYLENGTVRVSLLEGAVKVSRRGPAGAAPSAAEDELTAGEILVAAPNGPTRVRSADVARLSSWRAGLVSFDDAPLSEAVREINRYSARPIVLADAAAGRHRVSGTFRTGEPERFARTVSELFPLQLEPSADGRFLLRTTPK